ncbi:4175_t:CDS:2 [Funneliformis caledonium]|uniref:4175_t:CDS:1 n=1 Tax=Funneliformis caledonium TaxID=1117310 RepID=A0A9N8ZXR5_9GLOM|nr:4175_t:CDS:2 [Funneliformis caledonium]
MQKIDSEHQKIKQAAVKTLHQNSILAMHVIASGESPARTRLRRLRDLTTLI